MLQILDSDLDFQSRRIANDLLRALGEDIIDRRVIGPRGDFRTLLGAFWGFRGVIDGELVHTFGPRSLMAAAMMFPSTIIHSLPPEATDRDLRWLRATLARRPIHIVCSSDFDMRRLAHAGIDPTGCSLIHPGVDFSRIKPKRDTTLRQALNFREDDYVLLAPGESTPRARHDLALWTCAILAELDEHYKLLLWPRGPFSPALVRKAHRWRRPDMVRFAEPALHRTVSPEELLSIADAALITADNASATLPIALCMAAGLPIVSVVNRTTSELLEDRHTAAMVGTEKPRDLARRILDIRHDPSLQWTIADRARAEAYEHFSLAKSMDQWRQLYEEIKVGAPATLAKPNF